MSNSRVFSVHGQGLKLNTRADIEPHLKILREMKDVEEVHFGGNTLGVEASEALADVLLGLKSLKVRRVEVRTAQRDLSDAYRLRTSPIFSLGG